MGEMAEYFADVNASIKIKRQTRDEFYAPIIESLGGKLLTSCTYRLGDYNVYTSKGFVLHKSNKGNSIPLSIFLKKFYNYQIDGKNLNEQIKKNVNAQ